MNCLVKRRSDDEMKYDYFYESLFEKMRPMLLIIRCKGKKIFINLMISNNGRFIASLFTYETFKY